MSREQINHFRALLETKRAQLERSIRNRDQIVIHATPDPLEQIALAAERDLASRTYDLESGLLRRVRAALQRIEAAAYGFCLNCEEPIGAKRLNALPWAEYCIRCQEAADQDGHLEAYRPRPDDPTFSMAA